LNGIVADESIDVVGITFNHRVILMEKIFSLLMFYIQHAFYSNNGTYLDGSHGRMMVFKCSLFSQNNVSPIDSLQNDVAEEGINIEIEQTIPF